VGKPGAFLGGWRRGYLSFVCWFMSCPPLLFSVSFPFGLSLEYMLGCFLELFTKLNCSQWTKTIVKYIQQAIWLCGGFPVQWFDRCSSR
jgi:hypothetical protein